jgi:hypothetical protein
MSIISRIAQNFAAKAAGPGLSKTSSGGDLSAGMLYPFRSQPPKRGTVELLQAYKEQGWLRAVVKNIAFNVAGTEWRLYARTGKGGKAIRDYKLERATPQGRTKMLRELRAAGQLRVLDAHPVLDMLAAPNPRYTGRLALQLTQTHLDMAGEAFWAIERNETGMPTGYWPMPPHWIRDTPHAANPFFLVSFDTTSGYVAEKDILWLKDPDPAYPYGRGTGLAEALGDEIETDEYASKHLKAWFYNSAIPDFIVALDGKASPTEITRLKAKWDEEHRGYWNARTGSLRGRRDERYAPGFEFPGHAGYRAQESATGLPADLVWRAA